MSDVTPNVENNEQNDTQKLVDLTTFQDGIARVVDNLLSVEVSATLEAANWVTSTSEGRTIHTQTESVTVPSKYKNLIVGLASTATAAQVGAAVDAGIDTVTYSNGTVTFTATKVKPTIDIPIVVQMSTVNSLYEAPRYTEINNVPIATVSTAGKVKPDGTTVTVSNTGVLSISESVIETEFKRYQNITNGTTVFTRNASGTVTQIVNTTSEAVATTVFNRNNSGDLTSIVTSIVPTTGDYDYTQTTTFGNDQITDSYTRTAKE